MIILRNMETGERIPYSRIVGSHTYTGKGTKLAVVRLEDGREFPLDHGEILKVNDVKWEVYEF